MMGRLGNNHPLLAFRLLCRHCALRTSSGYLVWRVVSYLIDPAMRGLRIPRLIDPKSSLTV